MDKAAEFIESILSHAALYDPVKAHEYYIKNRELLGRDAAVPRKAKAKRAQKLSEGIGYVKSKLSDSKKEELKTAAEDNAAAVAEIRQVASTRKAEISGKLKEIFAKLSADRKASTGQISDSSKADLAKISDDHKIELDRIVKDTKAKIDALPLVPKGLSKEATQKLSAERSEKLAKIRGDASDARGAATTVANQAKDGIRAKASEDKASVSNDTATQKQAEKDSSTADREQLTADVKDSINSAKSSYASLKEKLKAKYEAQSLKEFQAVKSAQ